MQPSGNSLRIPVITVLGSLLSILTCGFPAMAATSAFSVNMTGTGSVAMETSTSVFYDGSASGNVSPFGMGTASVSGGGSTSVSFSFTISFSNGSSFSAFVSGPPQSLAGFSGNGSITGGSGVLAGATGSITMAFARSFASDTDFTFTMIGSGSITTPSTAAAPTVAPSALSFSPAQGSTTPVTQNVIVGNPSYAPATFTASASGGPWLSVSQTSGSVPAFSTLLIGATVNPTGLSLGIYNGQVSVSIAGQSFSTSVQVVVSPSGPNLSLSQTGLLFQVESGAAAPPSQTIVVVNSGSGTLAGLSAATSVVSGQNWLTASVASGNATANQVAVTVGVNSAGLAPGTYYGSVNFTVTDAPSLLLSATVVLSVAPANTSIGGAVSPTGLIFIASQGVENPAPQTVTINNLSNQSLTLSTSVIYTQTLGWISLSPSNGTVPVNQPVSLQVSVTSAGFTAGVYNAVIHVMFAEDMSDHPIAVALIVTGSSAQTSARNRRAAASTCTPTLLVVVFTALGDEFETTAGWPAELQALIEDDCGTPLTAGSVVASFSTGDAPISLISTGAGQWSGTWLPRVASAQATISVQAQTETPPLVTGSAQISGSAEANVSTPILNAGGVVSAASFTGGMPVAPGSFVAIFGTSLATAPTVSQVPYATQLAGTRGVLGGIPIPLYFASSGQINGIVPYNVPANSTQQLLVQTGSALSQPETVIVGAAQPAVFTEDNSGKGAGAILVQNSAGNVFLNTPSTPASAGDALLIYCAGLGAVNPNVAAGAAAPSSPLSLTTNPVTVTVGGQSVQVAFAGLAPGFAGLYQVNVIVPSGIAAASDVPVILTVAGASSSPVTVAIQ
jgi:uncharacterized protein (TIGR03437 family)